MRISPMIVWAAELQDEDFCKAIISDVELTHCNAVVHEAVKIFSLSVRHLLLHPTESTKARVAYNVAIMQLNSLKREEDRETRKTISAWIKLSMELYKSVDKEELVKF